MRTMVSAIALAVPLFASLAFRDALVARASGPENLPIVTQHVAAANIVLALKPHPLERRAATDLAGCVAKISGAHVRVLDTRDAIDEALRSNRPLIIIGTEAMAQLRQRS